MSVERVMPIGIFIAALMSPLISYAGIECNYKSGIVYRLKAVGGSASGIVSPVDVADGYHVSVSINDGPDHPVLIDTGSNALVVPYFIVKGLPSDPAKVGASSLVVSQKLFYAYGSSGNGYQGYLVRGTVKLNRRPAGAASPRPPVTGPMTLYAVTETCSTAQSCTPVAADSSIGMMGVSFKVTPSLIDKDNKVATDTNVFAEIPGLPAIGYVFGPDGVTVGVSAEMDKTIAWTPLDTSSEPQGLPHGCVSITPPAGTAQGPFCGPMMVDTGLWRMYAWLGSEQSLCQSGGQATTSSFAGTSFTQGTALTITSAGGMSYGLVAGPSTSVVCATDKTSHFNTGRMPLQAYSYARNQSCMAFGFVKN